MQYEVLGRTGVRVSRLCLGAMMFGEFGTPDVDNGIDVIRRALDAGINFIDTADVYSAGESERIVGRAIAGRRDDVVLATKFHGQMGTDRNRRGNSRRWIMTAVEESLRRLGTDHIDLYQAHRPDPQTPIEETLGALTDLVRQGKVRYIGTSTFPSSQIVEAQWASSERRLERFVCEQAPYSMLVRTIEADVLPTCRRHDVGVITYSPLTAGFLSGRYRTGAAPPALGPMRARMLADRFDMTLEVNQRKLAAADALAEIADAAGLTLAEMAIAFVLAHPAVTSTVIGPRLPEHLDAYLAAADARLDDATLDRIDEVVRPGALVNPADIVDNGRALDPASRRRTAT